MTKRLFDKNGNAVALPKHYNDALDHACKMIDQMELDNVDRGDMHAILINFLQEMSFHLHLKKNRA